MTRKHPPHDDRQLTLLHEPTESKGSQLERTLKAATAQPVNLLPDYALTERVMEMFRITPPPRQRSISDNYFFLQHAFFGLHNMESFDGRFGIAYEMLISMHPAEYLSQYWIADRLKIRAVMPEEVQRIYKDLDDLKLPKSVNEVGAFMGKALGKALKASPSLRHLYHRYHAEMHITPLKDRIDSLSDGTKAKFIASLRLPRRGIDMATQDFPYRSRDPHPENKIDLTGIDIYGAHIYKFLQGVYSRNVIPSPQVKG